MTRLDYELELWHEVMTFWDQVSRNSHSLCITILHSKLNCVFIKDACQNGGLDYLSCSSKLANFSKQEFPPLWRSDSHTQGSCELGQWPWGSSNLIFFLMFAEFWAWTFKYGEPCDTGLGKFICFFWFICSNMQNLGPSLIFSWAWQG